MGGCAKNIAVKMKVAIVWFLFISFLFFVADDVFAAKWDSSRSLSLSGIYSSNVDFSSLNEESEFITRVRPSVEINGLGRRLNFNLAYSPAVLAYKNSPSRNKLFHKLNTGADVEIIPEIFFFGGVASISQSIIDAKSSARLDSLTSGNLTDIMTLSFGPSISHDFNGYLRGGLNYKLGLVQYPDTTNISDSESELTTLTLSSGRRFRRLTWEGSYSDSVVKRDFLADSLRESAAASVRYKLIPSLAVLVRSGYENNQITSSNTLVNGSYSSAGFSWKPSRHISFDATKGDLSEDANLVWTPFSRMTLVVGYVNRGVGVNVGSVWSGQITHRSRRSTWQAGYQENVTNLQRLQVVGQQAFAQIDAQGNLVIDPSSGFPVILNTNIFGLTDEEFLIKRANMTYTLTTGKSVLSFSPSKETRIYELSDTVENVLDMTASWSWRFASKTRSLFTMSWQDRGYSVDNRKDILKRASVQLSKDFSPRVQVSTEYRFVERTSTAAGSEYQDHQIRVSLTKQFQRN